MEIVDNLKITVTNLRSVLTKSKNDLNKIKSKRIKFKKDNIQFDARRKKSQKIQSKSSRLNKSVKKIGSSTPMFKDFGSNILGLVGFLFVGLIVNNLEEITINLKKSFNKLKEGFKPIGNILNDLYERSKGFVDMFNNDPKTDDFKKVENDFKKAEPLINDFTKMMNEVQTQYKKVTGKYFGEVSESGTLDTGEKYDVINLYDKDTKNVMPFRRVYGEDGTQTFYKDQFFEPTTQYESLTEKLQKLESTRPGKKIYFGIFGVADDLGETMKFKFSKTNRKIKEIKKQIKSLEKEFPNLKSNNFSQVESKIYRQVIITDQPE